MSLLFESVRCKDGILHNLRYHQARMNLARKLVFRAGDEISIAQSVSIDKQHSTGLFRCRITYGREIETIEFIPHMYRNVNSLRLVEDNEIDYRLKYKDRQQLDHLFEQRGSCDDILIVKNGFITDSYTANVIFFDGHRWLTPDTPLLPGTQRARFIVEKKIFIASIKPENLKNFTKARLINAMQDMENMPVIPIQNIVDF